MTNKELHAKMRRLKKTIKKLNNKLWIQEGDLRFYKDFYHKTKRENKDEIFK